MSALALGWLLLAAPAVAEDWGPWADRWAPVGEVEAVPSAAPPRTGLFETLYRWYRDEVSPRNGGGCPYYPTCSAYGVLAVRAHGPLVGGMLTLDRLLREYPGMQHADDYPLVTPHRTPRLHDPPPARRERREGRP